MSNFNGFVGIINKGFGNFEVNSKANGSDLDSSVSLLNNYWSMINTYESFSYDETKTKEITRSCILFVQDVIDLAFKNNSLKGTNSLVRIGIVSSRLNSNIETSPTAIQNQKYNHPKLGRLI